MDGYFEVTEIATGKKTLINRSDVTLVCSWEGKGPDKVQTTGTSIWSGINEFKTPLVVCKESYEVVGAMTRGRPV